MPSTTEPMTCKCGSEFARAYYVDGTLIGAQVGSLVAQSMHGNCIHCGRGIHIQVSTREAIALFTRYGGIAAITVEIAE